MAVTRTTEPKSHQPDLDAQQQLTHWIETYRQSYISKSIMHEFLEETFRSGLYFPVEYRYRKTLKHKRKIV